MPGTKALPTNAWCTDPVTLLHTSRQHAEDSPCSLARMNAHAGTPTGPQSWTAPHAAQAAFGSRCSSAQIALRLPQRPYTPYPLQSCMQRCPGHAHSLRSASLPLAGHDACASRKHTSRTQLDAEPVTHHTTLNAASMRGWSKRDRGSRTLPRPPIQQSAGAQPAAELTHRRTWSQW